MVNLQETIEACTAKKIDRATCEKIFLQTGIIAELDAINLYETIADATDNKYIKQIMLDVAREEKTHVGEFQFLLTEFFDKEFKDELEKGADEVSEKTKII